MGIRDPKFPKVTLTQELVYDGLVESEMISPDYPEEWLGKVACTKSCYSRNAIDLLKGNWE